MALHSSYIFWDNLSKGIWNNAVWEKMQSFSSYDKSVFWKSGKSGLESQVLKATLDPQAQPPYRSF